MFVHLSKARMLEGQAVAVGTPAVLQGTLFVLYRYLDGTLSVLQW